MVVIVAGLGRGLDGQRRRHLEGRTMKSREQDSQLRHEPDGKHYQEQSRVWEHSTQSSLRKMAWRSVVRPAAETHSFLDSEGTMAPEERATRS